ncbi:bifunctional 2-polyprenyl-6-hydroxyphenol methylase/3-demethylubiquinol 3-O-methyltransferase UbiG [Frigoribacterium sp. PvP032]|uniref:class I SAM-dependent methyltransferase n=1 Tax=Frigoribacterium sp. PvP032 TaxID=2806589 RepID=UPI001AE2809E|nr:methyltransferase domain-containing protein [Frigoribacterium sp. PvP032]
MTADPQPTFGSGGAEPYARALRREGRLQLVRSPGTDRQGSRPVDSVRDAADHTAADHTAADLDAFDVARWSRGADVADLSTILDASSVLDIGCGPARMVRAAVDRGLGTLGVDVSVTAVAMAVDAGLPVVAGSVFDALPGEGTWDVALLLDGNIGIGGDPTALVARASSVVAPTGSVVVETAADPAVDVAYDAQVVDEQGRASATFPWAEVGREALGRHAAAAGLRVSQTWSVGRRTFCRLVRAS